MDYDVRDRARFLHALLRGVRDEKKAVTDDIATDQEDEEDLGGVVLRREQVSVVLLGKREAGDEQIVGMLSAPAPRYESDMQPVVQNTKWGHYRESHRNACWATDPYLSGPTTLLTLLFEKLKLLLKPNQHESALRQRHESPPQQTRTHSQRPFPCTCQIRRLRSPGLWSLALVLPLDLYLPL